MSNRAIRRAIRSLGQRIAEHEAKIAEEAAEARPNGALMAHWMEEIRAFADRRRRLEDRLSRRRRRGRPT